MGRNGIIVTQVGMLSSFWKLPTQQIPGVIKANKDWFYFMSIYR